MSRSCGESERMAPLVKIARATGALVVALALLAASCGGEEDTLRIGVLADCEGLVAGLYDISIAGAELPLLRRGGALAGAGPTDGVEGLTIGGRDVELVFGCAGEQTSGAVELRRLVESEGAEIVVGPNFVPLGLVTVEYARRQPGATFVVTSWESLLHLSPGANVFRFNMSWAQGGAGLGAYAYHELGWRRAATVAGVDPVGWALQAGPVAEFCALGGEIVDRVWIDVPPARISELFARLPTGEVDGFFLATSAAEAGPLLEHIARTEPQLGGKIVASAMAITGLDPAVAARLGDRLVGVVAGWEALGGTYPEFASYAAEYSRAFPELADGADANFHLVDAVYATAMEAVLRALETVDGDLSDGQERFRAALAGLRLDTPSGPVRLDENRQAIGSVTLFRVANNDAGLLGYELLKTIAEVDASFGGHFRAGDPRPDRTQPPCEAGSPPAWALAGR